MARRALQKNNGSPVGYGQPTRSEGANDFVHNEQSRDFEAYGQPQQESDPGNPGTASQPAFAPVFERGQYGKNQQEQVRGYQQQELPTSLQQFQQPQQQGFDKRALIEQVQQQQQPGIKQGLAQGQQGLGPMAQYGTGNIEGVGGLQTGNFMGQLEGFNTQGWGTGERGTESFKNAMGRLMSNVDVTQPGAAQQLMSLPEFKQLAPNAQLIQHPNGDMIDFGDGNGPVDVIRAAVAGGSGAAWQWGANSGGQQQGPFGGPQGPAMDVYNQGLQPQQQQLEAGLNPGVDPSQTQALLQYLLQTYGQGQQPGGSPDISFML
jgi:hypothetical protein